MAMKLVKGETLEALLAQRRETTEDHWKSLGIFAQVCQAVAFAHGRGVIHRDLKPANIMVGEFGEVQVMDWGIAKLVDTDQDAEGSWYVRFNHGHTRNFSMDPRYFVRAVRTGVR